MIKQLLEEYFDKLWPIHRSLTGNGNRATLNILQELIPLEIKEVPSGTCCFDWTIPPEWNIEEAWIKGPDGNTIIDIAQNNLHVVGYSSPISGRMKGADLLPHIYSIPEKPGYIPYVTSYYRRNWGFCMTHEQKLSIQPDEVYEVLIKSHLDEGGSMTMGEWYLAGETENEVLFSTYICHPSLANNELSGPLVAAMLAKELLKKGATRYSYRFLFVPETIGALYALSQYGDHWRQHLQAGWVLTCIGDPGAFTYKRSRSYPSLADRVAEYILGSSGEPFGCVEFFPLGSDERQYCSPGFNLPVGSLMRTMYGQYPEYHTSGDNKNIISFEGMEKSVQILVRMIELIELNHLYINTLPYGEPQLGKRGLYPQTNSAYEKENMVKAMMWILNYSDGSHDLIDICSKSRLAWSDIKKGLLALLEHGLLIKPT